jgi:hypothetical protein
MIEEQIIKLTQYILRNEKFFKYKDIVLSIEETEITNPMYYTRYARISVAPPIYMRSDFNDVYSVVYEKRGSGRYTEALRINATQKLAHEVVTKLLPKLDFKLKQELYNYEVEKALEALD